MTDDDRRKVNEVLDKEYTKARTGLYQKYIIERTDGSSKPGGKHENCRYFVLDMDCDPFARPALAAYAQACQDKYPQLAKELMEWVFRPMHHRLEALAQEKPIRYALDSDTKEARP